MVQHTIYNVYERKNKQIHVVLKNMLCIKNNYIYNKNTTLSQKNRISQI